MYRIRWRRDFIIPLTFIIMVGVLALVLLQLDRLYYQNAKYDIIKSNPEKLIPFNRTELSNLTKVALDFPPDSPQRKAALDQLREQGENLLGPDTPFFRFQVQSETDPNNPLLVIERDKSKSNNTWRNSLFLRDFSRSTDVMIEGMDASQGKAKGRYVIRFTTPRNSSEIEALTVAWRWRCLFIVVGFFAFYGAILKGILLPVRRVIACLERVDRVAPKILNRPGTLLERAYNNLARDASLTQFAARIRDRIASDPTLEPHGLLDIIPDDIRIYFGFESVTFWTLHADEGGSLWTLETVHGHPDSDAAHATSNPLAEYIRKEVSGTPPEEITATWKNRIGEYRSASGAPQTSFFSLVDRRKGPDTLTLMVIPAQDRRAGAPSAWQRETYGFVADQVRVALDSLSSQRRLIFQEKSKANISLSRNLGHDLTNIIATGKLDIMTVRRFLNIPPDRWVAQPQKEEIFRTSLGALLNNSRFLQEIVNLYRSFSYLSRPKFETVDPRVLVADLVELFRLSLSKAIETRVTLPDRCSECVVEPRLVKLALFNLLTNAADAIKRTFTSESDEHGRIDVTLDEDAAAGEIRIAVADSGTGILDKGGRPLSSAEMERVFHLGYSTKDKQEGEGLGLNWVHSIIADFHNGRVVPRNRPEGGAEFSVYLRIGGPGEPAAGNEVQPTTTIPGAQAAVPNTNASAISPATPEQQAT